MVKSVDTFKRQGLTPNLIVLSPEWSDPAGRSPGLFGRGRGQSGHVTAPIRT